MIAQLKTGGRGANVSCGLAGILLCSVFPGVPSLRCAAPINEPLFTEIPDASSYLTELLAKGLLRADVKASAANEHIPAIWSQCIYSGKGVRNRQIGFVFKFMVWALFEVDSLAPEQLEFHVTFAGGGDPPLETLKDLGKISYVFEKRDRTTLLVITGIQGPPMSPGQPMEFVATYYLTDPETTHAVRLEKLLTEARRHLDEWHGRGNAQNP